MHIKWTVWGICHIKHLGNIHKNCCKTVLPGETFQLGLCLWYVHRIVETPWIRTLHSASKIWSSILDDVYYSVYSLIFMLWNRLSVTSHFIIPISWHKANVDQTKFVQCSSVGGEPNRNWSLGLSLRGWSHKLLHWSALHLLSRLSMAVPPCIFSHTQLS